MIWKPRVPVTEVWYGVPVNDDELLTAAEYATHLLAECWFCGRMKDLGRSMAGPDYVEHYPIWHPLTPEKPPGGDRH